MDYRSIGTEDQGLRGAYDANRAPAAPTEAQHRIAALEQALHVAACNGFVPDALLIQYDDALRAQALEESAMAAVAHAAAAAKQAHCEAELAALVAEPAPEPQPPTVLHSLTTIIPFRKGGTHG